MNRHLDGNIYASKFQTIDKPSTKHVLCNIYGKPSDLRDEFQLFTTYFSSLETNKNNIKRTSHICGDFNIDLLKLRKGNTTITILTISYFMDFFPKNNFTYKNK